MTMAHAERGRMVLLAIESATLEVGAALWSDDGLLATASARPGRQHAERLHPLIAEVLDVASLTPASIGALAVDLGPGLFTGLRVGVAAAKAIAFGLGLPLYGLHSTVVLQAAAGERSGSVVAVVDLRRGEVAWSAGASLERGTPEALTAKLLAMTPPLLLVGDGAIRYGAEFTERLVGAGCAAPAIAGEELAAPPVAVLARLGFAAAARGERGDPFALEPAYLRDADVKINWSTRHDEGAAAVQV